MFENNIKELHQLHELCLLNKVEAFLVGGCVRDSYLGNSINDIDLVISKRAENIARSFAEITASSLVVFDELRRIYRVITDENIFDISLMAGNRIEEDLGRRDFTINAMAINLTEYLAGNEEIIDPFQGRMDMDKGILRIVSNDAFAEDPLRIWRAIRFSSQFNLKIDQETENTIQSHISSSNKPAMERIRVELIILFKLPETYKYIEYMEEKYGLLSQLYPEFAKMAKTGQNRYHGEDAWSHSLLVLKNIEKVLSLEYQQELLPEGLEPVAVDRDYQLKLAALLHDLGKLRSRQVVDGRVHYYGHERKSQEMAREFLEKLKFSNNEVRVITGIVKNHMRPLLLHLAKNLTDKGRYRFIEATEPYTLEVLIHSMADVISTRQANNREEEILPFKNFVKNLLKLYRQYKANTDNLFLSGKEIMEFLKIQPGPRVGKVLAKLLEAQTCGYVNSKEEALQLLKDSNNVKAN